MSGGRTFGLLWMVWTHKKVAVCFASKTCVDAMLSWASERRRLRDLSNSIVCFSLEG